MPPHDAHDESPHASATIPADPREAGAKPPFDGPTDMPMPGSDAELSPKADHGEATYVGHGRLTGKVALITGGDSGIGRAVALAYAREGADVLVSYLSEDEDAQETERLVTEAGRRCVLAAGDIQNEAHCASLVERAFAELGRLDILINNAAYQNSHESIEDISAQEFDRTFRTNVHAMFYLCRAALPRMQAGACIINTASINSFDPSPELLVYAATKGAIANFTKALAGLAIKRGIRVNAVAPGPVWTPLIPTTLPPETVEQFGADTHFGRPAQPAELAPVYVFLASEDARYLTGEVVGVTGGQTPV